MKIIKKIDTIMLRKDKHIIPYLRVINGESIVNAEHKRVAGLQILPSHKNRSIQFELPINSINVAPNLVVSVGLECLTLTDLYNLIQRYKFKNLLELRLAPEYRDLGFSMRDFLSFLNSKKIEYIHFPAMTNIARYFDKKMPISNYTEYIENEIMEINDIYQKIQNGPSLVMSYPKEHESSDRMLLLELLRDIGENFMVYLG